jgi:hypothetical protein
MPLAGTLRLLYQWTPSFIGNKAGLCMKTIHHRTLIAQLERK